MQSFLRLPAPLSRLVMCLLAASLALAIALQTTEAASSPAKQPAGKVYKIGFHLWKPGRIYDEAMEGIRDGLTLAGIKYEEVVVQSDQNKEKAAQNLLELDKSGLDLIYSLSSAGTKIAKKLELQTPVIATVINHPASLGLKRTAGQAVAARSEPSSDPRSMAGLTGTSYYVDAAKQLELYKKLFPQVSTVAMIFDNKNPAGALAEEPFMKEACVAAGLQFVSVGIDGAEEISEAATSVLSDGANLVVIPTNQLVYANLKAILDITNAAGVPVVSMNKQAVENGALAALFADTYNLGRQTAEMAQKILREGASPRTIAFTYSKAPDVIVNLNSAAKLKYSFPPEILGRAAIVLQ